MKRVIFIALAAAAATFLCKYLFCEEQQTTPVEKVATQEQTSVEEEQTFLKFLKEQLKNQPTEEAAFVQNEQK